jgi:restriction system protein
LINNYTGQLWALRSRIQKGDLIVMPMKTTMKVALGRVSGGYTYNRHESEPDKRHVVKVNWIRTDLPRTSIKQDLLFSLGSSLSVFAPSKNNSIARLESLLLHGVDPGALGTALPTTSMGNENEQSVDEPEMSADISEVALDQITAKIAEEFAGHGLAALVASVLGAEGYQCNVSPPGPDGGIDISAGKGPLGLDSPRLLVQVKSGAQIGAPVVSQLHGVMSTYGADQGLLVAWGGLSKPAREALKNHQMRVRVWEASDVVDAVLRNYDLLPPEIRTALPLRQVWMLSETTP